MQLTRRRELGLGEDESWSLHLVGPLVAMFSQDSIHEAFDLGAGGQTGAVSGF